MSFCHFSSTSWLLIDDDAILDVVLVKSDGMHVPVAALVGVSQFRTVGVRRCTCDENCATVESREDHHCVSHS